MSDLRELYQEIILDHNRHPRNSGRWRPRTIGPKGTIRSAATG